MNEWILKNRQLCLSSLPPLSSLNYWTPLANQVKELDPPESINLIHHASPTQHRVRFQLPPNHIERDSSAYRRSRLQLQDDKTVMHPNFQLRLGVLNGTIPSAVSNTGATSHALLPTAPSIQTGQRSTVGFHLPNGATASATTVNKLHHIVREPARSANIVPDLATNSLMSQDTLSSTMTRKSIIMKKTQPKSLYQKKQSSGGGDVHAINYGVSPISQTFAIRTWTPLYSIIHSAMQA